MTFPVLEWRPARLLAYAPIVRRAGAFRQPSWHSRGVWLPTAAALLLLAASTTLRRDIT
jgi:hypothetical protein